MKIKDFFFTNEDVPVVELAEDESEESEAPESESVLDDAAGAPDVSLDAPVQVDTASVSIGPAAVDSSVSLAPDPSSTLAPGPADVPALDTVDTSETTDESEVDESDTSESTGDSSVPDARLLLETPLDTYTVTEGLLLLAVIFLALGGAISLFKGR